MGSLINTAKRYLLLKNQIGLLAKNYGFSNKYLAEELSVSRRTIIRKIINGNWSLNQMIVLTKLIDEVVKQDVSDIEKMIIVDGENFVVNNTIENIIKYCCYEKRKKRKNYEQQMIKALS